MIRGAKKMQLDNIHPQSPNRDSGPVSYPRWTSHCPSAKQSIEAGDMGRREKMSHSSLNPDSKKAEPNCPWGTPYHIRVVVTHVDPLASREPGLVLKHLLYEAQVARVRVMKQTMDVGQSEPLLKRSPPIHNFQQSSPGRRPAFLH